MERGTQKHRQKNREERRVSTYCLDQLIQYFKSINRFIIVTLLQTHFNIVHNKGNQGTKHLLKERREKRRRKRRRVRQEKGNKINDGNNKITTQLTLCIFILSKQIFE